LHDGWRIAALVLSTAGYIFAFILIPRIIFERRQPAATVAWVLSIALLPVVGVPLYYLLGGRRIRRHIRAKIGAVGSAGSSVEKRVKPKDFSSPVAVSCSSVLAAAGAPPPVTDNRVNIINRGDEAYRAILGLIEEARDHIHAQFFILDVDPCWTQSVRGERSVVSSGRSSGRAGKWRSSSPRSRSTGSGPLTFATTGNFSSPTGRPLSAEG